MPNPVLPLSLTAAGAFAPFQLEPADTSCLISLTAGVGTEIVIESSSDNGVEDPWSPAPALRESTLTIDSFDDESLELSDGVNYRWRVDCAVGGSWVRVRVTALASGTVTMTKRGFRSGRFFLDAPSSFTVSVGGDGAASVVDRLMLMELMRIRTALGDPNSTHDLVYEVSMLDVLAAIAEQA